MTSFVGRVDARRELRELASSARLLTLVGGGGAGKTRLAVELAGDLIERFPAGAWLVELANVSDDSQVARAVADCIGVAGAGEAPLESLAEHISNESLLLILDNCEHVLAGAAAVAAEVLSACPNARVLTTTREPLGIEAETTWRVPSLSLPPALNGDAGEPEALTSYEAVELFVERARRILPEFVVTEDNAASIVRVCTRLDGIPLAIELAAARLRVLAPADIADRLDDRFRLLTGNAHATVSRHSTLRSALDWSYELLDDCERAALRRMSVFVGSFGLAAAERVVGPLESPHELIDVLDRLIAKSLVQSAQSPDGVRFTLLETVRAYAAEQLETAGETQATQQAHLRWCVEFFAACNRAWVEGRAEQAMQDLEREWANTDVALTTAAADPDPNPLIEMVGELWRPWMITGRIGEGRRWCELALARAGGSPAWRARALNGAANLDLLAGDLDSARRRYNEALVLRREIGKPEMTANTLNDLATLELRAGDLPVARRLLEEAGELFTEADSAWGHATVVGNLAAVDTVMGDVDASISGFEQAVAEWSALEDFISASAGLTNLAMLHLEQDDTNRAEQRLAEAFGAIRKAADHSILPSMLQTAALVCEAQGDLHAAAGHLGAAEAMRKNSGAGPNATELSEADALKTRLTEALGEEGLTATLYVGAQRTAAEALDMAVGVGPATGLPGVQPPGWGKFVPDGEEWILSYAGRSVRVRDGRGVRYLSVLLASPEEEVHVLDLVRRPASVMGRQAMADPSARAAYRKRLHELSAERDEATAHADEASLALVDREVAALEAELSSAFGLSGRERPMGDDSERARKAVSNRIRDAITRVGELHEPLGRHLKAAVHTGTFCSYRPEHPVRWSLEGSAS